MWRSRLRIWRCEICSYWFSRYNVRRKSSLPMSSEKFTFNEDLALLHGKKFGFVNELFAGKFGFDVLVFPEILDVEALKNLDNKVNLVDLFLKNEVDSSAIDAGKCIPEGILEGLQKLGLFGMRVPSAYGGLNLNATEYARLKEVIAQDSSVAELLSSHALGIQCLLHANDQTLNTNYLTDLTNGKLTASVCLYENGGDPFPIQTTANLAADGETWILNGTKKWVVNGSEAGIFIVVATTGEGKYSTFLVEKASEGVSVVSKEFKMGVRGTSVSEVQFLNTPVPKRNILSEAGLQFIQDVMAADMFSYGSTGAALLRKLLKLALEFSISKKYYGKKLHEVPFMQKLVAEISCRLYAIESLTYLTAGLMDSPEGADCMNESAIVKIFTSENVLWCIDECRELFGHNAYDCKFPFEQLLRDSRSSSIPVLQNDFLRASIAAAGLDHATFNYPSSSKKSKMSYIQKMGQKNDKPILDLNIHHFLHPSLMVPAKKLEYCVKRFQYALEVLQSHHGESLSFQEAELCHLSNLVINIYAMTAALGRASRSYCIGLQDSDFEVLVASTFSSSALVNVKQTVNHVINRPVAVSDPNDVKVIRHMIDNFLKKPGL